MNRYSICQKAYSKSIWRNFKIRRKYFCRFAVAVVARDLLPDAEAAPRLELDETGDSWGEINEECLPKPLLGWGEDVTFE